MKELDNTVIKVLDREHGKSVLVYQKIQQIIY